MTASYPDNIYQPRTVENKDGVVYNANETKRLFAEDINKANEEIVAIQNALGPNLENVNSGGGSAFFVTVLAIQNDPPASPSVGDQYIVGEGTGAWLGQNDKIAYYDGSAWIFTTPKLGLSAYVDQTLYKYLGLWTKIVRSVYIPLNAFRKGADMLSATTAPASVTYFGALHYIQWAASDMSLIVTEGIILPADIRPGSAFSIKVAVNAGTRPNEYFSCNVAGNGSGYSNWVFLLEEQQKITAGSWQYLTFTAKTSLSYVQPGITITIRIRHSDKSAKAGPVNCLGVILEYEPAY